jgi:uncharacterized membrane protein YhdT
MDNSDTNEETEYLSEKKVLQESLKKARRNSFSAASFIGLTIIFITALTILLFFPGGIKVKVPGILSAPLIIGVITFAIPLVFVILVKTLSESNKVNSILSEISEKDVENLQENIEEDFFTNLVKINFRYIDKYYLQTQIQADKSFILSVWASIISFVIIISGIILMYLGKTDSSIIATSAGVLSELVAAIFFYLYNKTIAKMGEYHHKLVLTQNISLALKITETMDGEAKGSAQMHLIEQLTKDINLHIASKGAV